MKITVKKKRTLTMFRPKVRSRHPSHSILREELPRLPFRSVIRLGSTTIEPDVITNGGDRIECNTVEGVKNSASKLLMKQCFTKSGVKTADWFRINTGMVFNKGDLNSAPHALSTLPFPIIAKHNYGSRGEGNTKIDTIKQLETWLTGKTLSNYIFERFYTYTREYRIHVTNEGCFYTCRKLIKDGTPESEKWHRHDTNSVWIVEENPLFDKPTNWEAIVNDCIKALKAVKLDIAAFDVKVQSSKNSKGKTRENPEWIIIESCSAPSFGEITAEKYLKEIPKVLKRKYAEG